MIRLQKLLLLLSSCAIPIAAQDVECPEDSMRRPAPAAALIWPDVEGDTRTCGNVPSYFSQPRECQSFDSGFDNPTSDCDYLGCDQPDGCSVDFSGGWCFSGANAERGEQGRCGGCGISCYVHILVVCCGGMKEGWSVWGDGCGSYGKDACGDNKHVFIILVIIIVLVCVCIFRRHLVAKCPAEASGRPVESAAATMQIQVPGDAVAGQQLTAISPDGQNFVVEVPSGTSPGTVLNVALPASLSCWRKPWKAGKTWPCWKMSLCVVLGVGVLVAMIFSALMILLVVVVVSTGGGTGARGRPFIVDGQALLAEATDGANSDWWTPTGEL